MARTPARKAGVLGRGALLPVRDGLPAGGEWIRNFSSVMPRNRQQRRVSGCSLSRRNNSIGFMEPDDRSGDCAAPIIDRPQPDRSLETAAYLARN